VFHILTPQEAIRLQKEKMHSLIGLCVFLLGSSFEFLNMLALSDMPGSNGLNPLYGLYISLIVIGVGLFVMLRPIAWGLVKRQNVVDVPRTLIPILLIGLGSIGFIWSYFSATYIGAYNECPPDGYCWAVMQLPVVSMILAVVGATLLQTPFVMKMKRKHMDARATVIPETH
jgi:hypothetical protein